MNSSPTRRLPRERMPLPWFRGLLAVALAGCIGTHDDEPLTPDIQLPPVQQSAAVAGGITFDSGFENGPTDNDAWRKVPANAASSSNSREGGKSVRFRPVSGQKRSELVVNNATDGRYHWGQEYWVGYSFNVQKRLTGFRIANQHHSAPSPGPDGKPNWGVCVSATNGYTMKLVGDEIEFRTATNPNLVNKVPDGTNALWGSVVTKAPYSLKTWHDVVLHFRYAPNSTGFFEIWLDGKKVLNHRGSTVYKKDTCGRDKTPRQDQKIGIYYGNREPGGELLYDAHRVGNAQASYATVAPGGGGPEPEPEPEPTCDYDCETYSFDEGQCYDNGSTAWQCTDGCLGQVANCGPGHCNFDCDDYGYAEGQCHDNGSEAWLCTDGCLNQVASCN